MARAQCGYLFHSTRCICPLCTLAQLVLGNGAMLPMSVITDETSRLTGGTLLGAAGPSHTSRNISDSSSGEDEENRARFYQVRSYTGRQSHTHAQTTESGATQTKSTRKGKERAKTNSNSGTLASTNVNALAKIAPFLARTGHPSPPVHSRVLPPPGGDWIQPSSPTSSNSEPDSGSDSDTDSIASGMGTTYFERARAAFKHGQGYARTDVKKKVHPPPTYVPLKGDTKTKPIVRSVKTDNDFDEHTKKKAIAVEVAIQPERGAIEPGAIGTGESESVSPLNVVESNTPLYAPTPSYLTSSTSTSFSSTKSGLLRSPSPLSPSPSPSPSPGLSSPHFNPKSDPDSVLDSRSVSPSNSFNVNVSRTHRDYQAGRESIRSVDAYHSLQDGPTPTYSNSDADLEAQIGVETTPLTAHAHGSVTVPTNFTLAHTHLEMFVHVLGIAITGSLIILSVWLTIADVRW